MTRHHSFPMTLAGLLSMACLVGAQYACQPDAPVQEGVAEQMDAEHAQAAAGGGEVHWSYEGDTGPELWGGLDPSFAVCDSACSRLRST